MAQIFLTFCYWILAVPAGVFHGVEENFPRRGKRRRIFSTAWKLYFHGVENREMGGAWRGRRAGCELDTPGWYAGIPPGGILGVGGHNLLTDCYCVGWRGYGLDRDGKKIDHIDIEKNQKP